jgi:hypothetical protein
MSEWMSGWMRGSVSRCTRDLMEEAVSVVHVQQRCKVSSMSVGHSCLHTDSIILQFCTALLLHPRTLTSQTTIQLLEAFGVGQSLWRRNR